MRTAINISSLLQLSCYNPELDHLACAASGSGRADGHCWDTGRSSQSKTHILWQRHWHELKDAFFFLCPIAGAQKLALVQFWKRVFVSCPLFTLLKFVLESNHCRGPRSYGSGYDLSEQDCLVAVTWRERDTITRIKGPRMASCCVSRAEALTVPSTHFII